MKDGVVRGDRFEGGYRRIVRQVVAATGGERQKHFLLCAKFLIRARTGEGRERAKARGVKMGRKTKTHPAPDTRGHPATRRGRGAGAGDCPDLQCFA